MSTPLDPSNLPDGNSEYCWGSGIFPPGIASNIGQQNQQDDFGEDYPSQGLQAKHSGGYENPITGSGPDGYALAVAARRTDTLDSDSPIDFEIEGNVDRYGPNPALVQEPPQPNVPWWTEFEILPPETPRAP